MSIHPPDDQAIYQAAALLRAGQLVAFPTETVYGLGADATNDHAVAAIYAAKGRPSFNPLISHVTDLAAAERLGIFDARALRVASLFWPGPLTLVVPRRADCPVSLLVSAGLDSIAIRVPAHPVARRLLAAAGCPVAAPSANPSGRVSPTTAAHVADGLTPALILDGGACPVGVESTVLDLSGDRPILLRPGGVARERLEKELGPIALAAPDNPDGLKSPGMLASHYAPGLPLRLFAGSAGPREALLGFGATVAAALNLSESGDVVEAAANLFAMLRALDRPADYAGIAVVPIPEQGLGAAINDRLRRAAAPR